MTQRITGKGWCWVKRRVERGREKGTDLRNVNFLVGWRREFVFVEVRAGWGEEVGVRCDAPLQFTHART